MEKRGENLGSVSVGEIPENQTALEKASKQAEQAQARNEELKELRGRIRGALKEKFQDIYESCKNGSIDKAGVEAYFAQLPETIKDSLGNDCTAEEAQEMVASFKMDIARAKRMTEKLVGSKAEEVPVKSATLEIKETTGEKKEEQVSPEEWQITEEQKAKVDQVMEALEKGEITENVAFGDAVEIVDEGRRDFKSIDYVDKRIAEAKGERVKTENQELLDEALADASFIEAFSSKHEASPDVDHREQMVRSWVAYKNAPDLARAYIANAKDIFKAEHGADIGEELEKQLVAKFQKQAIEDVEGIGESYFIANELERARQSIAEKEEVIEEAKRSGQEANKEAVGYREKRKETREELVLRRTYTGAFLHGFKQAYTQVDNEFGDSHSRPIKAVLSGFKGLIGKALDITHERGRERLEGYQRREKEALERVHSSEQKAEVERQLLAQLGSERDRVIDASEVLGEVWKETQKAAQENIRKLLNIEDLASLERAREKVLALKEVDDPIGILDNFSFNEGEESGEDVSEYINGLILQALAKEAILEIQKIEMHGEGPLKKLKNIVQKFGSKAEKDGIENSQARKVLKETFKQFLLSGKSKDRAKTLIFTTFYQQL